MTPGFGIFLIAVGAIIKWALNVSIAGVEEDTLGLILMIAGVAVIALWFVWLLSTRRRDPVYDERTAVDPRYRA